VKSLKHIDAEIRIRKFKPRALEEETGISGEPPIRGEKESDGYWNVRLLTYQVTKMHYRTPQLNLALLEHYINYQTAIRDTNYSAPTYEIRFETKQGTVRFGVKKPVDAKAFRKRFGLNQ
jgi:hypothetical protein